MTLPFPQQDFEQTFKDSMIPDLSRGGWAYYLHVKDFSVYRKKFPGKELFSYKGRGTIEGDPSSIVATLTDSEFQPHWNEYCKESAKLEEGRYYFLQKFPFPLSDREYYYSRGAVVVEYQGKTYWIIISETIEKPDDPPPQSSVIRAPEFKQRAVICASDEHPDRTLIWLESHEDPGGRIPTSIINWAARVALPKFCETLTTAAKKYHRFEAECEGKGVDHGCLMVMGEWNEQDQCLHIDQASHFTASFVDRDDDEDEVIMSDRGMPLVLV